MKLSVIIITKNAELTIEDTLKSVEFADEIIIVDSHSTDNTLKISEKYTDKIYVHDWQGYGKQKNRALSYAKGEWILNLDADEHLDEKLKVTIKEVIKNDQYDAYKIPIRMTFYNKRLKYSSSPTRHVRLFKKDGAQYSTDIVHEKIVLSDNTKVGSLRDPIWHDSFQDVHHALYKINRYSSYSAKIRLNGNKRSPGIIKSFFSALWMFVRSYILQLGFLDGREGLLFAVLNAQGSFYRHVKQIYPDRNIDSLPSTNSESS